VPEKVADRLQRDAGDDFRRARRRLLMFDLVLFVGLDIL
jgi:hypothetical protein